MHGETIRRTGTANTTRKKRGIYTPTFAASCNDCQSASKNECAYFYILDRFFFGTIFLNTRANAEPLLAPLALAVSMNRADCFGSSGGGLSFFAIAYSLVGWVLSD